MFLINPVPKSRIWKPPKGKATARKKFSITKTQLELMGDKNLWGVLEKVTAGKKGVSLHYQNDTVLAVNFRSPEEHFVMVNSTTGGRASSCIICWDMQQFEEAGNDNTTFLDLREKPAFQVEFTIPASINGIQARVLREGEPAFLMFSTERLGQEKDFYEVYIVYDDAPLGVSVFKNGQRNDYSIKSQ
ncbi:hypothetical protein GF318_05270 [Candidatus Micrarchaeota archaeon]|nr:hypothetical protein [Candidatus Micrarchaeota archaeon]